MDKRINRLINISSNQSGHSEIFSFVFFSLGINFPLLTEAEKEIDKNLKCNRSFTTTFSFLSPFLD